MSISEIVSIATALGLIIKIFLDYKNQSDTGKSGITSNLITNIEALTRQNLDLQNQVNDKQDQIDALKIAIDRLVGGRYKLSLTLRVGKLPVVEDVALIPMMDKLDNKEHGVKN